MKPKLIKTAPEFKIKHMSHKRSVKLQTLLKKQEEGELSKQEEKLLKDIQKNITKFTKKKRKQKNHLKENQQ